MKKNRHLFIHTLLLAIFALYLIPGVQAQESKKEHKAVKLKVTSDDEGNITLDTIYTLPDDFEGDWSEIIEDEELLEQLKNIKLDIDLAQDGNTVIVKSANAGNFSYSYSTDSVSLATIFFTANEIKKDILVEKLDGDSTLTYIIKSTGDGDGEEQKVMLWYSDDDGEEKEYKVVTVKADKMDVGKIEGEAVVTYKIKMDCDGEHEDVMIWHSDDADPDNNVIIKEIEGDSIKVFVTTSGDMDEGVKVLKKEVIIITDEDHDCDHDHDKDKKKKKKKKK